MRTNSFLFFFLFVAVVFVSCHERQSNVNSHLSLDDYRAIDSSVYRMDADAVKEELRRLSYQDPDSTTADHRTRSHYLQRGTMLWVDRKGVDSRADSLVNYLKRVEEMGFSARKFKLPELERDIRRIRSLDFEREGDINRTVARLEYNLTKAYLRYAVGQYFGFMNPTAVFNRLDILERDSSRVTYHTLFDMKVKRAGNSFFETAFRQIHQDSLLTFLRAGEPLDSFYYVLEKRLKRADLTAAERTKILVNMERCRWRTADRPQAHRKYVLVNIPSYHLHAFDGDSVLTMRIAFGSLESKTPLMHSEIKRMDINPQWIMPRSIMRKSVLPRLGSYGYFRQHQYFVRNRHTGKTVDWHAVSRTMLESGDYRVVQRGGEGNALGRIVFRFDNNLSIYLHDTSSRDVFAREDRDVSHGCVRVEKPFELAVFMLEDKDGKLIHRINYSMNVDVSPVGIAREDMTEHMVAVADTLKRNLLIGQVKVEPRVPVFICYYTLYPEPNGHIASFADVYGYDAVIYRQLRNFI